MKKHIWFIILPLLLAAFSPVDNSFEGTVRYDIKVSGANLGAYASMMPTYYEYSFKGSDMLMKSDALMMNEILIKGGEELFVLKRDEKAAYRIDLNKTPKAKPTVTKTDETEKIAGYTCRKYIAEVTNQGQTAKQTLWVTTDIQVPRPKSTSGVAGAGDFFLEGVDGFPLKMIVEMSGITMASTATSVKKASLSVAGFTIPDGFTIKEFDLSALFGN